jgi:hypothetical protein
VLYSFVNTKVYEYLEDDQESFAMEKSKSFMIPPGSFSAPAISKEGKAAVVRQQPYPL